MSRMTARTQRSESGSALRIGEKTSISGLTAPSHGTDAALPHERDQAVGQVAREPDPIILQAKHDLDAGLVDTDMRATPGLDAARRGRLVPGPTRGKQAQPSTGGTSKKPRSRTG